MGVSGQPATRPVWQNQDSLWLAAVAALGAAFMLKFNTPWDDAFISFRIAENWARTGLPVYNLGQVQPVATNFLWVAMLALLHKLTGISAVGLAQGLGALAGLGILTTLYIGLRRLSGRTAAVLAAGLCAASPAWAAWPLSGLETSWFAWMALTGLLAACLYGRTQRMPWAWVSGAAWALAALTRPEGAAGLALTLMVLTGRRLDFKASGSALGVFLALAAPALVFQGLVFHTLLPNAYFAKIHGFSNWHLGWAYLKDFVKTYRLAYAVPFVLPVLVRPAFRGELAYWGAWLALGCAWVVGVGGDFMPYHRFLSPLWPVFCIFLGLGLEQLQSILAQSKPFAGLMPGALNTTLAAMLALVFCLPGFAGPHFRTAQSWALEERDRARVGAWLAAHFTPADAVLLKPAGIIPYFSGLTAYDVYSLVDRRAAQTGTWVPENWVGHQRVSLDNLLELHPRLVILDEHLYAADGIPAPETGEGAVEHAWRASPLARAYTPIRAEIVPGRWLQYFEKNP